MTAGRSMSATLVAAITDHRHGAVVAPLRRAVRGDAEIGRGQHSGPSHGAATYRQLRICTRGFQQLGCSTLIWLWRPSAAMTASSTIMRS